MPDAQIHPTGTVSAPADYVLPKSAELLLKSVYAKYNGTAATGSFVPLIRIISDAGSVSDEIPQDVTVAAGGSADATWFPHVAAGASTATGTTAVLASGTNINTQTVTHGTAALCSFATAVSTSDATKLSWSTVSVPNDTLTLHGHGFAIITASCTWTAGTKIDFRILSTGGEVIPHDGWDSMSGYDATPGIFKSTLLDTAYLGSTSTTVQVSVNMTNSDGVDSGPTLAGLVCLFYPGLT